MLVQIDIKRIEKELSDTVKLLNDIYFEVGTKIYGADFKASKKKFFDTEPLLQKVIENWTAMKANGTDTSGIETSELGKIISLIIQAFEKNDLQLACDLILFDLCSALNSIGNL